MSSLSVCSSRAIQLRKLVEADVFQDELRQILVQLCHALKHAFN